MFYVDYGTVSETYKKDVRFLDKQFATQPAYALRGCLDRVRPNDGIWTYEAMLEFLDRLKDFFLVEILGKVTLLNLLVCFAIFFLNFSIYIFFTISMPHSIK